MNQIKRLALTGLAALVMGLGAAKGLEARTLRVPSEYPTIQLAVDASVDGDEVLVAPGRYSEDIRIVSKAITLKSELGYEVTELNPIFDPDHPYYNHTIVSITNGSPGQTFKIEGFTINGRSRTGAYGIYDNSVSSNGEVLNNIIENLTVGVLDDNSNNHPMNVQNNIIRNNRVGIAGGRNISIDHNLIYQCWEGIEVSYDNHSTTITNNTIIDNQSGISVGNNFHFSNNIIAFNDFVTIKNSFDEGNNDFYANGTLNWENTENSSCPDISQDPLFCDPQNGDYHLHSNSPCLPENNSCGLIGALGGGCESTPTKRTSWGKLKTLYK